MAYLRYLRSDRTAAIAFILAVTAFAASIVALVLAVTNG